jgi:tetratricopeptide (TPR) repeat protein
MRPILCLDVDGVLLGKDSPGDMAVVLAHHAGEFLRYLPARVRPPCGLAATDMACQHAGYRTLTSGGSGVAFWRKRSDHPGNQPALQPEPVPQGSDRVVRVFISSTFRDMQEERDLLVKQVFPELRHRCRERAVEFVEVDLRWGVTEEQAERGEVLAVCLAEIETCRPYFIGLLGERYGWIPSRVDESLLQTQPWLAEHLEHSVTELEILHGVLNNPDMSNHAFFYFRDSAYIQTLPLDCRNDFLSEGSGAAAKLASLKDRVRASHLPAREDYPSPSALADLVLDDLWSTIDRLYPEETRPDPLDTEATEHAAFARSRAEVYIGRDDYFARLDAHATGDGPPLVVLGESGSGKSALVANWLQDRSNLQSTTFTLVHFVGGTPRSADCGLMLRRIISEIKRHYTIRESVPETASGLRREFARWLSMAADRGRFVLILDGLDQLEDTERAPDLAWLPESPPENVRLIVSALPGRSLDALDRRGWPTLTVERLSQDERAQLVSDYLGKLYRKRMSGEQTSRLAAASQTSNPLYLKVLLEELRVFGVHEQLDRQMDHYLEATTVDALYERVLERLEQDYEKSRPSLVKDAMSAFWAARRGLTEPELLELLDIPRIHWSHLHLAMEESLVSRSGLLDFFHDYLRKAVECRYLPDEQTQTEAHLRLAGYFEDRPLDSRKVDELPWQLAEAGSWARLYDVLADVDFFREAWKRDPISVRTLWARVEAESELRIADAYRHVVDAPGDYGEDVWEIAALLREAQEYDEAWLLGEFLVDFYRGTRNRLGLGKALANQALILSARGDLEGALALQKEGERACKRSGDKNGLQVSLYNQANVLITRGDLDGAMALLRKQERICRELGKKDDFAASLGTQAHVSYLRGDFDAAMTLLRHQERICREIGDKDGLQLSLGSQATIHVRRGLDDRATALVEEQERICRELGDKDGLQRCLCNRTNILHSRGEYDSAMAMSKEQERICREIDNKYDLQLGLCNQSLILKSLGDFDGSMAVLKEQESICRELEIPEGLAHSLQKQARLLAEEMGRPRDGLPLVEEAHRIAAQYGLVDLANHCESVRNSIRVRAV